MRLRSVGWLSYEHAFSIGPVPLTVFTRLERLLEAPFQPRGYLGSHRCDLCAATRFDALSEAIQRAGFPERRVDLPPVILRRKSEGIRNLLVPGEHEVYVCPELIIHYIADHGYSPPGEFCRAVLRCPPIPSMRYFHALIRAGGELWVRDLDRRAGDDIELAAKYPVTWADVAHVADVAQKAVRLWRSPWYQWRSFGAGRN